MASERDKSIGILVVENDPADAELCVLAFRKSGLKVRADIAQTPEDFRLKVEKCRYDVILADYNLAGWTGMEAFEYSRRRGCETPFILVTGTMGDEVAVECIKRGVSDYVLKDRLSRLPMAVERALEKKSLREGRLRAEEEIRQLNKELERRVAERTAQLEAVNAGLQAEIADRKRAEKILRDSQERFRLVIDGARDYAIFMLDPQGRVASWNSGAERIKGYRAEEILGRHLSCFYTPEDAEKGLPAQELRVAAAEGRLAAERLGVRKDGSRYWASVVLTALHEPSGRLRGFSAVTRDITEQRQAQEALERLRLQEQLILDSAGDGIFGLDRKGACTFANPAGARMAGFEDLTGKPLDQYFGRPTIEGGPFHHEVSPVQAALKDGTAYHVNGDVLLRSDGAALAVDYVVTPMRSETGRILGAVVVVRDATERRAVEKMKDEFISIVSHEVRTPLTAVRAALGLLASGKLCPGGRQCESMIKVGVESTDRLVRLVSEILDLKRMESGKVMLEKSLCDASTLLSKAVDLMRVQAESRGIVLLADSQRVTFWADADRIAQVLINLVSNAIKFSPPGSTVRLRAAQDGGNAVFRVSDQGRGIPADKFSLIFERFQQVDTGDSRDKGGTGLGLAISKSIIAQHGGRIWVESTHGQGSTFFFCLPVETGKPEPASAARGE